MKSVMKDGERHCTVTTTEVLLDFRTWGKVESCTCSCAWCLHMVREWFVSAGQEAQHLLSALGSSPSLKHKQAPIILSRTCSAPARQSSRKDSPRGMYVCTAVAAVNIYVCFGLWIGKQDITETQQWSCLPSQHVLRYKYFYSFFGYLSTAS